MMGGMQEMRVRQMRVMRRLLVIPSLVVLRGLLVVMRRVLVMLRGLSVVFRRLLRHAHLLGV
jgi:hypothetical protein